MTVAATTALLARAHGWMLANKAAHGLSQNRLLVATVGGFLVFYSVAAYQLVAHGLDYVMKIPMLGPLLAERLIYLLFFFFFMMLVISNATITGMGLFRRKDMEWQVALPLPPRSLVMWKTLEGMLLASWGLIVLSAPILLALGRIYEAGPGFFLATAPALLCLVAISANLSTWLLLLLVRYARRSWWKAAALGGLLLLGLVVKQFLAVDLEAVRSGDVATGVSEILKHTEICMHPLLPSSWVAEAVHATGGGLGRRACFFHLVLLSHALVSLVVTARLAEAWFFAAWNRLMQAVPGGGAAQVRMPLKAGRLSELFRRALALDRASFAILGKEVRVFLREPLQWGQCAVIFGLLLIYSANLRSMGDDLQSPFWTSVISHLNLLVCCLALSTLTTRFIYPQLSLEGQRMWILGLSPVPLHRVLALKLRLSAGVLALLMTALVCLSGISLGMPLRRMLFFSLAMMMMSYGLTALSLSLGALLPNFREANPARIVSGFGGTVCLISSFIYILTGMMVVLIPSWSSLKPQITTTPPVDWRLDVSSLGILLVLTALVGGAPYFFAKKRTKSLDYLRDS
ncbi:MAG: putative ABC transporter permease subunit [Prosthecobacter sp.]